jgi:pyridoxamine 5'-phosphate oxidase
MTAFPEPAFYNDLTEILNESWRLMARGVADRRSSFHHPTVATLGDDGRPRLRTVILRGCHVPSRTLRFHTDDRSQKVQEITRDPRVGLHFYDPTAKIQLRLDGVATLHREDSIADSAWAATRSFSRQCYGIQPGPGVKLDEGKDFTLPETTDEATAPGRANFCPVTVEVKSVEWLYLAAAGHRRAMFNWDGAAVSSQWLTP